MKTLTPADLVNPKRQSGYDHVSARLDRPTKTFRADVNRGGQRNQRAFQGPRRRTALEAAQDYCNYVNGGKAAASVALKSAGHKRPQRRKKAMNPKRAEAYRLLREADAEDGVTADKSGWVYLVAETGPIAGPAVKIGKTTSAQPGDRLPGLQTGNQRPLTVLGAIKTDDCQALERKLHARYYSQNELGEWFHPTPALLSEFGIKQEVKAA